MSGATTLQGVRVELGDPIQVAEGIGHCWFAQLAAFPTGELLATVSVVADSHQLLAAIQAVYLSGDRGRSWRLSCHVAEAVTSVKFPRPDGDLLMVPGHFYPESRGQWRRFAGTYTRYRRGGRQIVAEPRGARLVGLPRDVASQERLLPGQEDYGVLCFDGDGLEVDGRLLTTTYLRFAGDDRYSVVAVESDDDGRTWRYLATIAGPSDAPGAPEGPCEPSMARLETGELMCVMRVGSGRPWNLARSYSDDGGRSWSPVDRLPAFSVEPCLRRLSNGTLVLSTGRPGIYLWVSTDPRGTSWQSIDVVAHHNARVADDARRITPVLEPDRAQRQARDQTTAYTELVEIEPNRLLLIYDRVPFGWKPVPVDSDERGRVFVLPVSVERA